ncbi:hypothetical protein [Kribbella speibonae]|uniref:Uncharacterized protein n=1 Tax=Kribbella speibonae TaxID=1572660 RepID=A0A4R0IN57_9ACTN|nr:hypothetical protein [Kribbella speibonae]TCC22034.1 hypothetical protein E0H58_24505 [Kribbella speibonae]TCC34319.1 hypothetical protein E0H92_30355 [Kribbella speibonae]
MSDNARPSLEELDKMPDDISQEDQAKLLVEPSFDHDLANEAEELQAEFGPAEDGEYGRAPAEDREPTYSGKAGS